MFEYAITVKKTRKPVNIDEYANYLNYIKDMFTFGNVHIETTKGLHIHFLLTSQKRITYSDLYIQKHGWSIRAVPIYNRQGWTAYSSKDFLKNYALTNALLNKVNKPAYEPTEQDYKDDPNNDTDIFYPYDGTDKDDYIYDCDTPISEENTEIFYKNLFISGVSAQ